MFAHDIISIIFRGINIAILVGASIYLFNRYALNWIKDQITRRKNNLDLLQQRADTLVIQQKECEQALIDQQKLCQILLQRVAQWNAVFNRTMHEREQEKEKRKELLQKKVCAQQNYIAAQHAQEIILPAVIEQARKELIKGFGQQEKSQRFIESLVTYMDNRARKGEA